MACPVCELDPIVVAEVSRRRRAGYTFKDITSWLREVYPVFSPTAVERHLTRVKEARRCQ